MTACMMISFMRCVAAHVTEESALHVESREKKTSNKYRRAHQALKAVKVSVLGCGCVSVDLNSDGLDLQR